MLLLLNMICLLVNLIEKCAIDFNFDRNVGENNDRFVAGQMLSITYFFYPIIILSYRRTVN